jgi:hypothetical protein
MPTIEHRQMKICSTCFDVTVSLLRTIEMTICVAPNVMLDKHLPKSELLLIRLLQVFISYIYIYLDNKTSFFFQLLSQIINRLATKNYVLEEIERLKLSGKLIE